MAGVLARKKQSHYHYLFLVLLFVYLFFDTLTHFRYSETYKMMDLYLTAKKKIQIALVFAHSYAPRVKMLLH